MPTLKDVADISGVSPITVSRVINNPMSVKETTRKKVTAAMKQINYIPNMAAKSLASKKTGVIDVYIPENVELSNPFFMYLIAGISNVLSKQLYSFLVLRNLLNENQCDGYIVTGLLKDEVEDFRQYTNKKGSPMVLFGHSNLEGISCIDVDNYEGSRVAVNHLISIGHKNIAMINVSENKDYTADREAGYMDALKEHEMLSNSRVIYADNNVGGGIKAARKLMDENKHTAIFCATDTIAIGVVSEYCKMGLSVPDDVSVIGFDGLGHHLMTSPNLTTIVQPVYKIGELLAQTLLNQINGKDDKTKILVKPEFLEGKSTGTPRK